MFYTHPCTLNQEHKRLVNFFWKLNFSNKEIMPNSISLVQLIENIQLYLIEKYSTFLQAVSILQSKPYLV